MAPNKNLLLKIRSHLPAFNPALRKIAEYILENPKQVKLMRVKDLAGSCGVSEATVTRFVQTIGLAGFQELKIVLAEITSEKAPAQEFVYNDVTDGDSLETIVQTISFNLNRTVEDTKNLIEAEEMEKAVAALRRARKIDIYGAGESFLSAEHARMRFYRIGKRCLTCSDPSQQSVSASLLTEKDVALGISNSGSTVATVKALKLARAGGAATICITNHDLSPLTRFSDIKLFTSTQGSAFFQQSMVSWMAQMLIIDILYARLAVTEFESSVKMIQKTAASLLEQHQDNQALF